jgi:hypothetical protein
MKATVAVSEIARMTSNSVNAPRRDARLIGALQVV